MNLGHGDKTIMSDKRDKYDPTTIQFLDRKFVFRACVNQCAMNTQIAQSGERVKEKKRRDTNGLFYIVAFVRKPSIHDNLTMW